MSDAEKTEAAGAATPNGLGEDGKRDHRLRVDSTARRFAVYCFRDDGRRRLFHRYETRDEADAVAKTLNNVGCRAEVEATP